MQGNERRTQKRYLILEDISKVIKDLKSGEFIIDLSLSGAKIVSLDPKRIGELTTFSIDLPNNLGKLEITGKNMRSKMVKFKKANIYETGIQFQDMSTIDKDSLGQYISYLERNKIVNEGREKIKELLNATKKLKKNLLILKCKMNPKEDKDTTQ